MTPSVRVTSPAKLNLGLAVLGRRPDGYHDLISVFHTISWSDTVTVSAAEEGIRLTCTDPGLPTGRENLVWKAADLVRRRFRVSRGAAIHLEKRIPFGAGLGGGSSDAAATVRALGSLWHIRASAERWLFLCGELGSDVPFFWFGGTALVEGRGERVTPIRADADLAFVVAVPPVRVSTPWAYRQLAPPFADARDYRARAALLRDGTISLGEFCRRLDNTFQPIVERRYPEVRRARESLLAAGATAALMSGSGSAVFGVFPDEARAREAAAQMPEEVAAVVAKSRSAYIK